MNLLRKHGLQGQVLREGEPVRGGPLTTVRAQDLGALLEAARAIQDHFVAPLDERARALLDGMFVALLPFDGIGSDGVVAPTEEPT